MFFVVWRGLGLVALLIAGGGVAVGVALDAVIYGPNRPGVSWPIALGLMLAAVVNWLVGRRLNRAAGQVVRDPATGQGVRLRAPHALYYLRMEWWSAPMLLIGAGMLVASVTQPAVAPPDARQPVNYKN